MFTELIKIIEGGLNKDKEKVVNYANLLAQKLEKSGEKKVSEKIVNLLKEKSVNPVYLDELMSTPVDQETRMSIVDVNLPVNTTELILPEYTKTKLTSFIDSLNYKEKLQSMGLELTTSLLLYGPPGCGKTSVAQYISEKAQLPLIIARLDSLVSSLLGNTAKNIRKIFDYAMKRPCILFLDEFDAIAKARDDQHELGELKRVVNSLLQNIDNFNQSNNILIAATNHHNLLDSAIWRRFPTAIEIPKPGNEEILQLISLYIKSIDYEFRNDKKKLEYITRLLQDCSPSDIKNVCYNSIKSSVISNESIVTFSNFVYEIFLFKSHGNISPNEIAKFLNENGVYQAEIQKLLKLSSIRQVRNLLEE